MAHIVILGAGASGTLTAVHVLREARRRGTRTELSIVAPEGTPGRGVAFGTTDALHLLNVPSTGMSAFPDEPEHFDAWLASRGVVRPAGESLFAPRRDFGHYLGELLEQEIDAARPVATVSHERALATAVRRDGARCVVTTDGGRELVADAAVVATGLPAAGDSWAPRELREHPGFVADPWRPGVLDEVRRSAGRPADVLVVGAGLTMVDVVLTLTAPGGRADRRVHAVSRRGSLPEVHLARPATPVVPDVTAWGETLASIRTAGAEHLARVEESAGDWRPGIDGLRFRVAELWQRLDGSDRARFIAEDASVWNELRHRMPPSSAVTLAALEEAGTLSRAAGEVRAAVALAGGGVRITMSDGAERDFGWVVNCTGPRADVRTLGNPLLDDLLAPHDGVALASVSTGGMGLRTIDGRLLDPDGRLGAPVWTLGALRRGELWESTSVPEIRAQARGLASELFDAVSAQASDAARDGTSG